MNAVIYFVLGALIGSFLNVLIYRLPRGLNFVTKRSHCPHCEHTIAWYYNIPLLGFLFLRAKCAYCKAPISWRYFIVELITATFSLYFFSYVYSPLLYPYEAILFFTCFCILVVHFFIDIEHYLLLDSLNIFLLVLIALYSVFHFDFFHYFLGGLLGFGMTYVVTWIFYKVKGQVGLGGGDIKLFGILGLYLGPIGVVYLIFLSCLLGSIVGITMIALKKMNKDQPLAFGPYIIIVALWQIYFTPNYLSVMRFLGFSL